MLSLLALGASLLGGVSAAPVSTTNAVDKRSIVTDAPHFVIYADKWLTEPPAPSNLTGWNNFLLCFWTNSAQDDVMNWGQLTADQRATYHQQYNDAGINLMMSAFGSTATPTSSGSDPVDLADQIATFVKNNELDGVDVDYEDFSAMNDGKAVDWLVKFQTELRAQLPSGQYIITHAPVAPWFEVNATMYPQGNYLDFHKSVGDTVDWYNVQFYNQGTTEYTDCTTLLTKAAAPWSTASLFEIAANGVPQDKLVIGKPAAESDASNGYMSPADLKTCVDQAKAQSWNGGLMIWEYPDGDWATWVSDIWGSS